MSKLDDWVTIHYKEDSIPSLRGGPLTNESKKRIKDIYLELIGGDEPVISNLSPNKTSAAYRNKLRAELRQKVEEL